MGDGNDDHLNVDKVQNSGIDNSDVLWKTTLWIEQLGLDHLEQILIPTGKGEPVFRATSRASRHGHTTFGLGSFSRVVLQVPPDLREFLQSRREVSAAHIQKKIRVAFRLGLQLPEQAPFFGAVLSLVGFDRWERAVRECL